jgi:hypothetical protein
LGKIVIACYRPKPGKQSELEQLTSEHVAILRAEGLATDRIPIAARSKDGTIVEVFEWASQEAIDRAHESAEVRNLWGRYEAACDYVKVVDLAEAGDVWATFEPLD